MSVDVFGLPESIVSVPELVATMINAASPREGPMETMDDTPFAGFLSIPYNWLSTLMSIHAHSDSFKIAVCIYNFPRKKNDPLTGRKS